MGSFHETIAAVKEAADLVEYAESVGVTLKPAGHTMVASCPLPGHEDSTPSFTIYPATGTYHCFGCQRGGDILSFVQETSGEGLGFREALHHLAGRYNVPLPEDTTDDSERFDYRGVRAVLEDTRRFFQHAYRIIPTSHPAKTLVAHRGITHDETLGYAPAGGDVLYRALTSRGHSKDSIVAAGVCGEKTQGPGGVFDFWQDRLMFPILSPAGEVLGFSGRKLREDAWGGKYVNSKSSPIFDKSRALYTPDPVEARDWVREHHEAFIVEGQFDVLALREAGVLGVFASSGTVFTPHQGALLRRWCGDQGALVFCFDADPAGVKAAQRVLTTCSQVVPYAWCVEPPAGCDPADVLTQKGVAGVRAMLQARTPLLEFVLTRTSAGFDLGTVAGRAGFVEAAADLLGGVVSPVVFREGARLIAQLGVVDVLEAQRVCEAARVRKQQPPARSSTPPAEETLPAAVPQPEMDADDAGADADLAHLIRTDPVYTTAAAYIKVMATGSMGARAAVTTGAHRAVIPVEFHPLLDELATMDAPLLVPERFTYRACATLLFNPDAGGGVLPQCRYETEKELMGRAEYLYHRLKKLVEERAARDESARQYAQLVRDGSLEALRAATESHAPKPRP